MQQQYQCPQCGAPTTFGSRFCANCGLQLNWTIQQQAQPPLQYQQPKEQAHLVENKPQMNWFGRHLNWTIILTLIGTILIVYIVNTIATAILVVKNPAISAVELEGSNSLRGLILTLAILSPQWGWVLKKKNRSTWWLLVGLFVPFGIIVLLALKNRRV